MTLILKQIFQFLRLLNSDKGHKSIAFGVTCGFILGMTPSFSLQSLLIFICLFLFRIQMGAAFVTAFFFAFIALILDPVFHSFGSHILEMGSLKPLFTQMYNTPILPFTRFNNTIVMGSGAVSFLLSPIIFLISLKFIIKYREVVVARIKNTKVWKAIKMSTFYQWYTCLLYTSPSPRDKRQSRMPSSA